MLRTYPIILATLAAALLAASTHAALPPKTPAQQQAAAEKKAKDDAQAAVDKQKLTASMDAVAARWRARAASQGWKTHAPVAIAAPAAAVSAPITGAVPGGQPGPAGAGVPIKSEKLGTAAPSADVKAHPTRAQPRNAPPAVVKKNTPQVDNR
jgi:colicin import membrane protein